MTLDIICPSMGGHEPALDSWLATAAHADDLCPIVLAETMGEHAGFLAKLQQGYEISGVSCGYSGVIHGDLIAYFHADLTIHEHGWDDRVLHAFADDDVAVAGFVGATRLGHQDIYRVPYSYKQLARANVMSNLRDAEAHGQRSDGAGDVAVLDSCAIIVRRTFLDRIGGWPVDTLPNTSHCTDLWICAMARRHGQRVRFIGVGCEHASGGKGDVGSAWLNERGGDQRLHREAHSVTYNEFRDVLPFEVR